MQESCHTCHDRYNLDRMIRTTRYRSFHGAPQIQYECVSCWVRSHPKHDMVSKLNPEELRIYDTVAAAIPKDRLATQSLWQRRPDFMRMGEIANERQLARIINNKDDKKTHGYKEPRGQSLPPPPPPPSFVLPPNQAIDEPLCQQCLHQHFPNKSERILLRLCKKHRPPGSNIQDQGDDD